MKYFGADLNIFNMALIVIPLGLSEANELVRRWHRHHKEARGHKFSIGVYDTNKQKIVGAAIIGRPVARLVNYKTTIEVTRLVTDGTKNACSVLYSAAARIAKEMGYEKIQTYILDAETGVSLKASGWHFESISKGGRNGWNNRPGRRNDQPKNLKQRWVKILRQPILISRENDDFSFKSKQLTFFEEA